MGDSSSNNRRYLYLSNVNIYRYATLGSRLLFHAIIIYIIANLLGIFLMYGIPYLLYPDIYNFYVQAMSSNATYYDFLMDITRAAMRDSELAAQIEQFSNIAIFFQLVIIVVTIISLLRLHTGMEYLRDYHKKYRIGLMGANLIILYIVYIIIWYFPQVIIGNTSVWEIPFFSGLIPLYKSSTLEFAIAHILLLIALWRLGWEWREYIVNIALILGILVTPFNIVSPEIPLKANLIGDIGTIIVLSLLAVGLLRINRKARRARDHPPQRQRETPSFERLRVEEDTAEALLERLDRYRQVAVKTDRLMNPWIPILWVIYGIISLAAIMSIYRSMMSSIDTLTEEAIFKDITIVAILYWSTMLALIYLVKKSLDRRNNHFRRSLRFHKTMAKLAEELNIPDADIIRSKVREMEVRYTRREPKWLIVGLAIIPGFLFYILHILHKDFWKHSRLEALAYRSLYEALSKAGVRLHTTPDEYPVIPNRNTVLYAILSLITGIFTAYWFYTVTEDVNEHFRNHTIIENHIVDAFRKYLKSKREEEEG